MEGWRADGGWAVESRSTPIEVIPTIGELFPSVTHKFIGFGDIQGLNPYKFIGFGHIQGPKLYKFIGFGHIQGPKPYKFIGFGDAAAA